MEYSSNLEQSRKSYEKKINDFLEKKFTDIDIDVTFSSEILNTGAGMFTLTATFPCNFKATGWFEVVGWHIESFLDNQMDSKVDSFIYDLQRSIEVYKNPQLSHLADPDVAIREAAKHGFKYNKIITKQG